MLDEKRILLIISGGIAAYKSLDLIRLIKKSGGHIDCILTKGGEQFVTPLSVSSLSHTKVYQDLWSLTDEVEMGHIRLSRESDLIVVAPASADLMAKMAHGFANDLASTTLLASNKPVMVAPAMNPEMWNHPATQENLKTLEKRGIQIVGPNAGEMACGETGKGRMSEPQEIFDAITSFFFDQPLKGKKALVTSGPTYEPLDPVRFLGNRSSGKQGHAIAKYLARAGASVTLVSGPTQQPDPAKVNTVHIETAKEMLKACEKAIPSDIAVFAAAVSDWTATKPSSKKIKKEAEEDVPKFSLSQNPDILKTIANLKKNRPELVIGFAAETENLEENARKKLKSKNCDWIIGNEVGTDKNGKEKTFGACENQITFFTHDSEENWDKCSKEKIAQKIVQKIIEHMKKND
ncbi:MAG: bifunctional phosphopantothenoylcysteine decarboxylase/phosphopantothenate--cysteine ligase CoaBC [Alphaproteobacteria bacterium]|nr:bifunctional phosphopantothenoylcysteine decarboxylase/phosphopantothenate--cysteine ligase CoaBC [Alphaproteobacteria bacterium]